MLDNLKKNFNYFRKNHNDLLKQYPNLYLVIANCDVIASFASLPEAISFADTNELKSGDYIIQYCTEGESAYTSTFCSQIICSL